MSGKYETSMWVDAELRMPKMFTVIMHNDDYTTMEFVVEILVRVFHKSEADAGRIMMEVHKAGSSAVGVYTYDVASTKKSQTEQLSVEKGFPLKLTVEENTQ